MLRPDIATPHSETATETINTQRQQRADAKTIDILQQFKLTNIGVMDKRRKIQDLIKNLSEDDAELILSRVTERMKDASSENPTRNQESTEFFRVFDADMYGACIGLAQREADYLNSRYKLLNTLIEESEGSDFYKKERQDVTRDQSRIMEARDDLKAKAAKTAFDSWFVQRDPTWSKDDFYDCVSYLGIGRGEKKKIDAWLDEHGLIPNDMRSRWAAESGNP